MWVSLVRSSTGWINLARQFPLSNGLVCRFLTVWYSPSLCTRLSQWGEVYHPGRDCSRWYHVLLGTLHHELGKYFYSPGAPMSRLSIEQYSTSAFNFPVLRTFAKIVHCNTYQYALHHSCIPARVEPPWTRLDSRQAIWHVCMMLLCYWTPSCWRHWHRWDDWGQSCQSFQWTHAILSDAPAIPETPITVTGTR